MSNPSGIDRTSSSTRRAVLGAALASGTAGCLGYLDDGPNCTLSLDDFDADLVSASSFSHTNSNVRSGGSCDRSTTTRCLEVSLRLDPAAVDSVEARTPDGEVVVRRDVDDGELEFELAVLERGDRAEFEVALVDSGTTGDGETTVDSETTVDGDTAVDSRTTVDSATVAIDC